LLVTCESPLCCESPVRLRLWARGGAVADEQTPLKIGGMEKLSSCAIVGNSGHILEGNYGKAIDNHEIVVRVKNLRTSLIHPQHCVIRCGTSVALVSRWPSLAAAAAPTATTLPTARGVRRGARRRGNTNDFGCVGVTGAI
jgi:hypothetical protein